MGQPLADSDRAWSGAVLARPHHVRPRRRGDGVAPRAGHRLGRRRGPGDGHALDVPRGAARVASAARRGAHVAPRGDARVRGVAHGAPTPSPGLGAGRVGGAVPDRVGAGEHRGALTVGVARGLARSGPRRREGAPRRARGDGGLGRGARGRGVRGVAAGGAAEPGARADPWSRRSPPRRALGRAARGADRARAVPPRAGAQRVAGWRGGAGRRHGDDRRPVRRARGALALPGRAVAARVGRADRRARARARALALGSLRGAGPARRATAGRGRVGRAPAPRGRGRGRVALHPACVRAGAARR